MILYLHWKLLQEKAIAINTVKVKIFWMIFMNMTQKMGHAKPHAPPLALVLVRQLHLELVGRLRRLLLAWLADNDAL